MTNKPSKGYFQTSRFIYVLKKKEKKGKSPINWVVLSNNCNDFQNSEPVEQQDETAKYWEAAKVNSKAALYVVPSKEL